MLVTTFVAIALLLAVSAFFSGSETALTAVSRGRMHQLEKDGSRAAANVNRLVENRGQRSFQHAGDGAQVRLKLQSVERAPVILDDQTIRRHGRRVSEKKRGHLAVTSPPSRWYA